MYIGMRVFYIFVIGAALLGCESNYDYVKNERDSNKTDKQFNALENLPFRQKQIKNTEGKYVIVTEMSPPYVSPQEKALYDHHRQ
jgi:hypothetical protein